jgi:hypothetical protein
MSASRLVPVFTAALAVVGLVASAAPAVASASGRCPARTGELAHVGNGFGRVWHRGSTLYACTTVYGHRPKAKYVGTWTPTTKVAFDGVNLAWSVRRRTATRSLDRVYATNVDSATRWMSGQQANPGAPGATDRDRRVQRIVVTDQSVAWVTQSGDVVAALRAPAGPPEPIGTFPGPLTVLGQRLLPLGTYTDVPAAVLAATLSVKELPGEGDECGGGNPYRITFRPGGAGTAVLGARWDGYWTSTNTEACF